MSENINIKETVKKPRVKKPHKPNSYKVTDEYLFYKICDAGIGYTYLHGVNRDKDGKKVFHFDRNDEIKSIIDKHNEGEGN